MCVCVCVCVCVCIREKYKSKRKKVTFLRQFNCIYMISSPYQLL